jgi:putative resolvase
MKLSDWARKNDISYKTAWRWFHEGKLPVPAKQVGEGKTIIVFDEGVPEPDDSVVIYCRVSGHDQKDDLERQVERLKNFASAKGWEIKSIITEIGSGLNGKRPKLLKILKDPNTGVILVEHRDRLTRFGFEYLESALKAQRRKIVVADQTEETDDLWQDFIDVVTSMCARIYGKRGARNRANKLLKMMRDNG